MTTTSKNGAVMPRMTCAVLFLIFTFLYLYDYQADILAVTQHVLSHGQTNYNRLVGALLITVVLWMVQIGVYAGTRLKGYTHALTYFPSLLLLGILTDITPNIGRESYIGHWWWLFPLLMVVYAGTVWLCKQFESVREQMGGGNVLRHVWINLFTLTAFCLMTCSIGCNDYLLHYRMRMENEMRTARYDEALQVGVKETKTDSSLTLLRVWALSYKRQLGERLFEYPLVGRSASMLPNDRSVRLLMLPETTLYRHLGAYVKGCESPMDYLVKLHAIGRATPAAHDWLLCAYLLEGNMDAFANALPRYYDLKKPLPKHYREALTLYTHTRKHPSIVYKDPVLEADYEDYQALCRKTADAQCRYSALRDSYGGTFWFYYYALKHRGM